LRRLPQPASGIRQIRDKVLARSRLMADTITGCSAARRPGATRAYLSNPPVRQMPSAGTFPRPASRPRCHNGFQPWNPAATDNVTGALYSARNVDRSRAPLSKGYGGQSVESRTCPSRSPTASCSCSSARAAAARAPCCG
jgi:hypothetical protein